ncbi:low-density lipoprotein receptor-related protein 2-like isoform X2 [Biomphalaria glabrata]|uniref:Low-density lipoprotein receptor-related protein 2-like isoform X2 n=1 Tax=Biomphalaria glabrata TaxID=6526 RepID=A0A9U8EIR3_BIOGL|nr:low-density lipoprotein receptor-related protein 2-like isoform X2 [Biomphalaria glabrata]
MTRWHVLLLCFHILFSCIASEEESCGLKPFYCSDVCISSELVCDEQEDCPQGEDERECPLEENNLNVSSEDELPREQTNLTVHKTCRPNQFLCDDKKQCIHNVHLCDGHLDCTDHSDEAHCNGSNKMCWQDPYAVKCDNLSKCISSNLTCDGHAHCLDATDEHNNCSILCKALNCEHHCGIRSEVVECFCRQGFETSANNKSTCVDIDECNLTNYYGCSQICDNVPGSFVCSCLTGYEKINNTKCSAKGAEPALIYAVNNMIQRFTLKKHSHDALVEHLHGVKSLATDAVSNTIFWLEEDQHSIPSPRIYYMDLSQRFRNKVPLVTFGLLQPRSLAYDYYGNNLYVTDVDKRAILACKPGLPSCITVFDQTTVTNPVDLALYTQEGLMYWIDLIESSIFIGSMDGNYSSTLKSNLVRPACLHIDVTTKRLYWFDGLHNFIRSVHLDGSNDRIVVGHQLQRPITLLTFEDDIYWVGSHSVRSFNKFTGHSARTVLKDIPLLKDMAVNHPSLQTDYGNPCKTSRCSHFCLLGLNATYICACPDEFEFNSHTNSCTSIEMAELLVARSREILSIPLVSTGALEVSTLKTESMRNVGHLAYLSKSDEILYTDVTREGNNTLNLLTNRRTQPRSEVLLVDAGVVDSLAVDESSSVIYWVNKNTHQIHLASLNGERRFTFKIQQVNQPHALAIDPLSGFMFLFDVSTPGKIIRCFLDDTSCITLVSDVNLTPDFLYYHKGNVYFRDRFGKISSAPTDNRGSHGKSDIVNGAPITLAVYEDMMFWTQHDLNYIECFNLEIEMECRIETDKSSMRDLVIAVKTTLANTSCSENNGGCHHICIPLPHNVRCLCSDGYILHSDLKTCVLYQDKESPSCEGLSFKCKNKRCVSQSLLCDGEDDCGDNSDETGDLCPAGICKEGEHKCSSNRCIPGSAVCDGIKNCHDGSDEASCTTVPNHCKQTELACSLRCISQDALCDGYKDCVNGEDERNCSQSHCPEQYQCLDGQCVNTTALCDNIQDCTGKDKANCSKKVSCTKFQCSQVCTDTLNGPTCSCHKGFQLVGKTICQDVDECSRENGGCSQKCLNKKGTHQCWCVAGYTLGMDQRGCKANGPRPYLIVGTHLGIRNVSLASKMSLLSLATHSAPKHIDMNGNTSEIYWTEYGMLKNTMTLLSSKGARWEVHGDINGIAVDWITNNVYITQVFNKEGRLQIYNNQYHKTLLAEQNWVPKEIVLHPNTSLMFWLSFNGVDKLERSWMDGLQHQELVRLASGSKPMALAIDHATERLYWLSASTGTIETCKLDGTQKFSVTYHLSSTIYAMDVFEGLAYLTDLNDSAVVKLNTYDTMHTEPKIRTMSGLGPIKVVHRLKQPIRSNPCQELNCLFLCVLIPYGGRCLCHEDYVGLTNSRCTGEIFNGEKPCSLNCLNGGECKWSILEYCSCPPGYNGRFCDMVIKKSETNGGSKPWLVGLLVAVIVVVIVLIAVVLIVIYKKKSRLLVRSIRFTDPKFTIGKSDDEEGLVHDISFNETSPLDEVSKNDSDNDPDWWKRLICLVPKGPHQTNNQHFDMSNAALGEHST